MSLEQMTDEEREWLFALIERCADTSYTEIAAYIHQRWPQFTELTAEQLSAFYLERISA